MFRLQWLVQFQDVCVKRVSLGRDGTVPIRCSWHRKAGVKPEYEAFSPVSAGNSAVRRPRMC